MNRTAISDNMTTGDVTDAPGLTLDELIYLSYDVFFWVQGVVYTIVCSIGILSNLLNIVTLWRQRHLVTYRVFLVMACADLVVVSVLLSYSLGFAVYRPVKIVTIGHPPNLTEPYSLYVWWNVWFHVQNTFMCISNWCVVLVAIFRLIAITCPLRAVDYASTFRVNLSLILVCVGSVIILTPLYISLRWSENGAAVPVEDMSKYQMITLVFLSPLPLFLCTLSTIILIIQLKRQQSKMSAHMREEQMTDRQRDHRQMTITLFLVLLFFIITNIPDVTYWWMDKLDSFKNLGITAYRQVIFYLVSTVLTAVNYSGNFFIYILANRSFRKDLGIVLSRCLLKRGQSKLNRAVPSNRTSSTAV